MKSFLLFITLIALVNGKPSDYDYNDSKLSYGLKYNEHNDDDSSDDKSDDNDSPNTYYSSGIFTKYPDDPNDDYQPSDVDRLSTADIRSKRQTEHKEKDPTIDVNQQASSESKDVKRPERKTSDQTISLRNLISSVESDLVSRAQLINANVRIRRAATTETTNPDSIESVTGLSSAENNTNVDEVNKNFFDGIFEYTRPERETEEKNVKIPLEGLVDAVESTLINSAHKFKDPSELKKETKRDVAEILNRRSPDSYQVKALPSSNIHDLSILNPITFKAVTPLESITTEPSPTTTDEALSTTEFPPYQRTNLSVVHTSGSVHLVPGADQKLAHVQLQQIQKTVFHSSLAIFPTVPPQSINVPLVPTTEIGVDTTTIQSTSSSEKVIQSDADQQKLSEKVQKLKEKIAEIQAEPVILSQI